MTSAPQPRADNSELAASAHPTESTRLAYAASEPGATTAGRGKARLVVPTPLNVSNIRNHRSPVERAIRLAVVELRYCALLWMLGFVLVLVKNADFGAPLPWAVAFLPLWLGNVRAIALCCRIVGRAGSCYDRIMSGTDYVRMVRAPTYRTTDPSLLEFAIPEDLVHLVNRGTVGALVAVPTFMLLMWTEVMLCMHLSGGSVGKRAGGLWAAMAPLLFIEAVMVAQWALIKSNSWRGGLVMGLCFLSTVSLTHAWATYERAGAGASGEAGGTIWWPGCIPLWLLTLVFFELIVSVVRKHFTGMYRLRPSQLLACGLYFLACAFSASAEVLLAARAALPWGDDATAGLVLPLAGLGVGIICGGGALMIVIEVGGRVGCDCHWRTGRSSHLHFVHPPSPPPRNTRYGSSRHWVLATRCRSPRRKMAVGSRPANHKGTTWRWVRWHEGAALGQTGEGSWKQTRAEQNCKRPWEAAASSRPQATGSQRATTTMLRARWHTPTYTTSRSMAGRE